MIVTLGIDGYFISCLSFVFRISHVSVYPGYLI